MSALSDYLEDEILDHILGTGSFTMPTVYVALFTSADGLETNVEGDQDEPSGSGYARQAITFDAASGGSADNQRVEFPRATGSWGTITHMALMDASTSGNVLVWAALTTPRSITTGDVPIFFAGELVASAA